jgi:hypothetical protein
MSPALGLERAPVYEPNPDPSRQQMSPALFHILCCYGLFAPVGLAYTLLAIAWCGDMGGEGV